MSNKWFLSLLIGACSLTAFSQQPVESISLPWHYPSDQLPEPNAASVEIFSNCEYRLIKGTVFPFYFLHKKSDDKNAGFQTINKEYSICKLSAQATQSLKQAFIADTCYITWEKGIPHTNLEVFPFRINPISGNTEKLVSFDIVPTHTPSFSPITSLKKADFATQSVLASGEFHKLKIPSEGLYRITVADLKTMNIDPAGIEASSFKIYGNPGGLVSEVINDPRHDDLKEMAIQVVDANQNNRLDGNDELRFYAEGPHVWKFNKGLGQYTHENQFYDLYNYVFLTFSQGNGKRIQSVGSGQGQSFDTSFSSCQQLLFHESDLQNFIASGREWFGESLGKQNVKTFSHTLNNVRIGDPLFFRQRFGSRSVHTQSSFSIDLNGSQVYSATIPGVSGDYDQNFMATPFLTSTQVKNTASTISIAYKFNPGTTDADAWVDFYELAVQVGLQHVSGQQQQIYLQEAAEHTKIQLELEGEFQLWNTTDYHNTFVQETYSEGGKKWAIVPTSSQHIRLAMFDAASIKKPEYLGKVVNQNLHGLSAIDYIIVSPSEFISQANRLATFHQSHYGYQVAVVTTTSIYNEFSGGKKDAAAIRDFVRMVYDRGLNTSRELGSVLMFGDGSYDFKDRVDKNTDFVPTFQSRNSYDPSYSYASDDFFVILDAGEGYFDVSLAKEGLDVGIGRIPCRNVEQARIMVDKIINYHQPTSFGEWRNRLTFIADDEDRNQHFDDSELVSRYIDQQNPVYNIDKIYLDAYVQESYGSGQKYPDVNAAVDRNFDKGHFVLNYLGHGGPSGLAHERIITRDQIRNWANGNKLPVVITATCELTRYDDPSQDSPGELMLFDDDGGAIALITTTRLVYINLNRNLNDKVLDQNMFNFSSGKRTLGEIIVHAKNRTLRDVNQRNFSMIGDPAMVLAYPTYNVLTTTINDSLLGVQSTDTFKAFSKMKVSGEVRKPNGDLASDYNGLIYPTVYDKYLSYSTLANDATSFQRTYTMQNSAIYRGKVSVINGAFSFSFVVPKDISYKFGQGKIVYYTDDGVVDGNGYESRIHIGGSSSDVADDKKGPDLELFMDDYSFIFGGVTRTKPLLLCKVFDENGINTVGNGIGRDITAILDEGTENEQILVLNDYYQSKLDSYQEGEIRFNLERLAPGKHSLKIRVWDVYNNASEDYTEFVVANDEDLSLQHVLNYPNPFTTHTSFHFDHNKEGQTLDVQIQVINISGQVVQTFHRSLVSAGSHFQDIDWDGRDAYGDRLARGVYLYKISVKAEDGTETEAIEKLVLLK